jgi:hypothetical protein
MRPYGAAFLFYKPPLVGGFFCPPGMAGMPEMQEHFPAR